MRKLTAGGMTNKLKAKARVTLSALDMKKLILTNLPYLFIFCLQTGHPVCTGQVPGQIWETNYYMLWNTLTGF